MNTCVATRKSCLRTRVKAMLADLVVQSNIVWILACGLFFNNSLCKRSTSMPCLGAAHLLSFHHCNKRESKWETSCRLPQKVWFCGPSTCSALLLSWEVDHLIETAIPLLFSIKIAFVSTCTCTSANVCLWIFVPDLGVGPQRSPNPLI